ncbi:MAG: ribosomal RNA small subunit methyltransferase A [Pirellulales bacterium]|nr:ribosomal RNA small subunit methyltransferase A [Pirellulales bacterium]
MPEPRSKRQTLSFLMKRFEEVGIEPRKKLGQNFLIDLNLLDLLLGAAELGPDDVVLEVGTGTGSLSARMAQLAAEVVTVELDPQLFEMAGEELHGHSNVHMLHTDVLKNKNRLNPAVLDVLDARLAAAPGRRLKLVSNLPYNIATPILTNLLARDNPPATMTVTIQKELADRVVAVPRTKDYGALSVWVQSQCRARVVRVMPPSVFWPRPKVDSAILHVAVDPALRDRIADREFFHGFVRALFLHRRKFLRSVLASAMKNRLDKPTIDRVLAEQGLDGTRRAEELDVETVLRLADAIRAELAV